ncbi:MAG TPA: LysR family transcriptional regulator [Dongiaceae bacterium]|nr:LysR family transcriptional regulator [Dongiaceae bacterium]
MRLFEAAGRLGSFKAAATELLVTPSAVIHGVQSLEDWLRVELFIRGNRSISPFPATVSISPSSWAGVIGRVVPRITLSRSNWCRSAPRRWRNR